MSKRKIPMEADEEFILKTSQLNLSSQTAVKKVVIHDFKRMMVEAGNCPKISSPKFQLAGINMFVTVEDAQKPGFIFIGVDHDSRHDLLTSGKVIVNNSLSSGGKIFFSWEMKKVAASKWFGHTCLSTGLFDYTKLAKECGDILELEVTVTVHTKVNTSSGGEWTRYYQSCISLLYSYLCVVQD